eukprot:158402-Pyramimonas_sp.AAC.1
MADRRLHQVASSNAHFTMDCVSFSSLSQFDLEKTSRMTEVMKGMRGLRDFKLAWQQRCSVPHLHLAKLAPKDLRSSASS